jgi:spore maturation protein CgeB
VNGGINNLVFMKAVFVASLKNSSASGRQRLWAMQQCGVEVTVIDRNKYGKGKIIGRLAKAFRVSRLLLNSHLQDAIYECCQSVQPDLVWFEWAKELTPELLRNIKNIQSKPLLVSFQDDNPWGSRGNDVWMWNNYFKIIPQFDIHLVKRHGDIDNLNRLGAKECYMWKHGIYGPLFHYSKNTNEIKYPVSFIGTCMDSREELVGYLLDNNVPIHVFGNRWEQRSNLPNRYPDHFHSAVEGEAYVDVIRSSGICLGLVSHSNLDEWTMRTYEVPGCAKLLLAEQTKAHQKIFGDAFSDKILFSSSKECLERIEYFLSNESECSSIGIGMHKRFLDNNWTLDACMAAFLTFCKEKFLIK